MPAELKDGNLTVTCDDCGKPLTQVNAYGMFCDEMCGYEESVKASELLDIFISDLCSNKDSLCSR